MAQDFPNNPTLGQVFGSYVWNGTAWAGIGSANNLGVQVGGILAREAYDYHPNYIINGAFDINQRNMTASNIGTDQYTLDRWYFSGFGSGQPVQITKETDGGTSIPGGQYARIRIASNNNTNVFFSQSFDNNELRQFRGKTVTLSFYYSSSTPAFTAEARWGTYVNEKFSYTGNGNQIASVNCPTSAGWVRKTLTFTVPATAEGFCIMFSSTNISNALASVFQIAGVQLEEGSVATPFRRNANSIQGELAACQRYYQRLNEGTGAYRIFASGWAYTSSGWEGFVSLPVPMRTIPTAVDTSALGALSLSDNQNPAISITSIAITNTISGNSYICFVCGMSGAPLTQYRSYMLRGNNNSSAYVGISAEL